MISLKDNEPEAMLQTYFVIVTKVTIFVTAVLRVRQTHNRLAASSSLSS